MIYLSHLITPANITVVFSDSNPVSIPVEDSRYELVSELLQARRYEDLGAAIDFGERISHHTKGKFAVVNGVVVIEGEALPQTLSDKLLEFVEAKEDTTALEKFWQNLKKNPSKDSKQDLFDFMRANKMPITPNGHFIAYKRVRENYLDCYTGTICNKPGKVIKMLREEVDANRAHTCSAGLHVAAYSYASNFNMEKGILLEVEVNPRDVVAVPPDYKQQKMRVCRYRVIQRAIEEIPDLIYRRQRAKTEFEELGDDNEITSSGSS